VLLHAPSVLEIHSLEKKRTKHPLEEKEACFESQEIRFVGFPFVDETGRH